jgi:alanyl-tRNA synthetase
MKRNIKYIANTNFNLVWNNVFIAFNREPDRSLRPLPNKHVDTGMGFERLVSILQDKPSNYDTDVFMPLFKTIQQITGARSYEGKFGAEDADGVDTAYRVVADHVRLTTFAISDGGVPNNIGRGYVVRRVLRRGARYARKYLKADIGSFFSKIVPTLVAQMGDMFPEIKKKEQDVKEILDEEELAFALSLDRGETMFNRYAQQCKSRNSKDLPGSEVWRLYDTYGFPVDLTKLMAEELGLIIDDAEVAEAQEKAREASKAEKKGGIQLVKLDVHDLGALEKDGIPKTDDDGKYRKEIINAKIVAVYHGKKFLKTTTEFPEGEQFGLLLDKTNFYAESGGQEYDTGRVIIDGVAELDVQNVQSYGGYVLHTGYMKYGTFSLGDEVICDYDELRRQPIRNNHTGTHILNFALRETLGWEVDQKGSLVAPEKLRFDFSHKSGISDGDLQKIENISMRYIKDDSVVYSSDVQLPLARKIQGVRAVFGETYPDPVRVVSIGMPVENLLENAETKDWEKYSIEFCGGTHVERTGEIKELIILEESAIARGIRRIVAVTGQGAADVRTTASFFEEKLVHLEKLQSLAEKERLVKTMQLELNNLLISTITKKEFIKRFDKVKSDILKHQKEAQKAELDKVISTIKGQFDGKKADSKAFVGKLQTSSRTVTETIKYFSTKDKTKSIYLISIDEATSKVSHGCFVSDVSGILLYPLLNLQLLTVTKSHASKGLIASEWSSEVAKAVGGKAGGKGSTSIGSGIHLDKVDEGVALAIQYLEKLKIEVIGNASLPIM